MQHKQPDRVARYDSFWIDTLARWRKEGLPEEVSPEDYFDFDIRMMGIDASPRFKPQLLDEDGDLITLRDRFGYVVRKSKTKSRTMQFISHPVNSENDWNNVKKRLMIKPDEPARTDIETYPFRLDRGPDWDVAFERFAGLSAKQKYILGSAYGPHEAILRLRGFEQTLYDICDHPDLIRDMAQTYTDFLISVIRQCLNKRIRYDGFFMVEDLAGTNGMLFSPDHWRRLFKPSIEKIGSFLCDNKLDFWMHCCGNARPVFEDLIECGLQVLNPLEAKSGLDVRVLKKRYGSNLTFFGNIDVMKMAESDGAVESEICEKITVAKQDGGYIYHSDHSIPPEVSFQRYLRVQELVKEYGAY